MASRNGWLSAPNPPRFTLPCYYTGGTTANWRKSFIARDGKPIPTANCKLQSTTRSRTWTARSSYRLPCPETRFRTTGCGRLRKLIQKRPPPMSQPISGTEHPSAALAPIIAPEEAALRNYDAVIVGSGISGAIMAHELTSKGHRVLVLEAGLGRDLSQHG